MWNTQNTHFLVNKCSVDLGLILVTGDRALKCVDDVIIRVMLIVVEHTVVGVFLHSKNDM